ncbi:hypothetical protein FJ651_00240 [Paucihalobacter ruber]|uniref:Uncharacterized protein n=2 Tax=Paucihalobacter ruber TaxID=2567861 RepID=A0A506PQC2_9FLAO|nr:hypothetical protein FJ651_00240 [Paucihalobacter ruber]
MIKFFRKIRYNLMSKNSTGKYLKYAIGEILLVVIGILIALQINNWNESKKNRAYEVTMLREVNEALEIDLTFLNENISYLESALKSYYALGIMKNEVSQYRDSLFEHLDKVREFGIVLNLNISAYEAIKSGGLDKISDLTIKNQLSKLYGVDIPFMESWINEVLRTELYNKMELLNRLFYIKSIPKNGRLVDKLIIEDETIIYNNPDFDKLLRTSWPLQQTIRRLKLIRDDMTELKQHINQNTKS